MRLINLLLLSCIITTLVQCQSPMELQQSQTNIFPTIETKTLAGNPLVFPEGIKGKKSFIAMVFEERGAYMKPQNEANQWTNVFEENLKEKGVVFYEIPMMAAGYGLFSGWIDSGMRSGIPPENHDNVACYYGNKKKFMKALNISDMGKAHIFLLDEAGRILGQVEGDVTDEKKAQLLASLSDE